jgi:hypothetical protein
MQRRHIPVGLVLIVGLSACPGDGGDSSGTASASATGTTTLTTSAPTTGDPTGGTTDGTTTLTPTTTNGGETGSTSGGEVTGDPGTTTDSGTTQGVESTTTGNPDATETDSSGGESSTGEPLPPSDIEVVITADNAYSFAYGTQNSIAKFFGGVEAITAAEIFDCGVGPEKYTVPAADAANASYLYIIAWDDSSVTNGVLARFRRTDGGGGFGQDVFTGTPGWEVCATGLKYELGSGGPSLEVINEYIGKCNAGTLDPNTSSGGWVDEVGTALGAVAFGEDNTTPYEGGPKAGNEFPLVCPADMPAEARWMWFNWDPANVVPPQSPFIFPGGQNPYHQFLLFRFAAELVPVPQ